jgi:hypothetical protein
MKLGAGIGASPGQNLEQTANKLFKEVQNELDAALSPEDAAFRKQAYEAAMQLRPQEILFELRSAGVDTIGVCVCVCGGGGGGGGCVARSVFFANPVVSYIHIYILYYTHTHTHT